MNNLSRLFEEIMILVAFCEAGIYFIPPDRGTKVETTV